MKAKIVLAPALLLIPALCLMFTHKSEQNGPPALRDAVADSRLSEFRGHKYPARYGDAIDSAQGELNTYTSILEANEVRVVNAGLMAAEGYLEAKVSYRGKTVLFRVNGNAPTVTGAKLKMKKRVKNLRAVGAVILRGEVRKIYGSRGLRGMYEIEYFRGYW